MLAMMTREALWRRIQNDRAAFAAVWADLSREQMVARPGPQEDWSVKDLIAHITWWEQFLLERLTKWLNGETLVPLTDYDAKNAEIFEAYKDVPLEIVLDEFDASLLDLEEALAQLDDEQLHDPDRYPTWGRPLFAFWAGNTFGHYGDHIADLQAYVRRIS